MPYDNLLVHLDDLKSVKSLQTNSTYESVVCWYHPTG